MVPGYPVPVPTLYAYPGTQERVRTALALSSCSCTMKWLSMNVNTNFDTQDCPLPKTSPLRSPGGSTLRHYPNVTDTRNHPVPSPAEGGPGRTNAISIPRRKNSFSDTFTSFAGGSFSNSFGREGSLPESLMSKSTPVPSGFPQQFCSRKSMYSDIDCSG